MNQMPPKVAKDYSHKLFLIIKIILFASFDNKKLFNILLSGNFIII